MDFKRFFKRRKAVESSALNEEQPVTVAFGPCCFCGSDIGATETDPCSVTVETVAGKWQVWYCHASHRRRYLYGFVGSSLLVTSGHGRLDKIDLRP